MEKLNIAELLKDCPKGMELNSPIIDNLYFDHVTDENITCYTISDLCGIHNVVYFKHNGSYISHSNAKCVIFPKGKTTWEGFQRPFKDGDVVATRNGAQIFIFKEKAKKGDGSFSGVCYFGYYIQEKRLFKEMRWLFNRHATSEEKQKLFDAIKANGYKWNAETKTLEKLIEPKFKVGDVIQNIDAYKVKITEVNIEDECYGYESMIAKGIGGIGFSEQDNWELVPNKFDISTLKLFKSRVLVRSTNDDIWRPAIYGFADSDRYYIVGGVYWKQCIPYKGNWHLLGTTNNCDEYFKTWE